MQLLLRLATIVGALLIANCSSQSVVVYSTPPQYRDQLLNVLSATATREGFQSLLQTRIPDACAFAYYDEPPNSFISLQARQIGGLFEVRLSSSPLGKRYDKFQRLAKDIEQSLRMIYGDALVVDRDAKTYTVCDAK